jgi:hypothetical protein
MKSYITIVFVCLFITANNLFAQQVATDSTGLPGDNFSLQGALQMFKESKSLEEFEKKLNTADNHVNNLDLDGNDSIDYIRVIDKAEGTSHAIILQDAVSKTESQDIAVIEIEKNGKESATLQIIGDKEIYGDSVFVEPVDQAEVKPGQKGPYSAVNSVRFVFVNVWFWPCVPFIYDPYYVPWVSPWRWHYYPIWWSPWYPLGWGYYHPYCMGYHAWYRPVYEHRVMFADKVYLPYRTTSSMVVNKYQPAHTQYNSYRAKQFQKQSSNNVGTNKQVNNVQPNKQENSKQNNNPSNEKQLNNKQPNDKQVNKQPNGKQANNKQGKQGNKKQKKQKKQKGQKRQHPDRKQR